jgi:LacI family repressor for deo operon, udp, cdd, tsx, nupC, and nupG
MGVRERKDEQADSSAALMRDVAELAGVAVSTVSRALGKPGRVNEQTRERIAKAAATLGYTPNAVARNLRKGSSRVVMIVLPGPLLFGAAQIIPLVLEGVTEALAAEGFNLMIANLGKGEAIEQHILDLAYGGTVAGALVLASYLPRQGARSLVDAGIPLVGILQDVTAKGVPSVVTNDRAAMHAATRRLIALGHRRFYYVAGTAGNYHEFERFSGVLQALEEVGLGAGAVRRFAPGHDFQLGLAAGEEAGANFLAISESERPTAALCCSDDVAISLMSALLRAGVSVPDQVSVFGFDGAAVGSYFLPSLSTIVQPAREMGARAAELLLARLRGEATPDLVTLDSHLLERESIAAFG